MAMKLLNTFLGAALSAPHFAMCRSSHSETAKVDFTTEILSDVFWNWHVCFGGIVRPCIILLVLGVGLQPGYVILDFSTPAHSET